MTDMKSTNNKNCTYSEKTTLNVFQDIFFNQTLELDVVSQNLSCFQNHAIIPFQGILKFPSNTFILRLKTY